MQFWITEHPQLFEFEVASYRPCRLRSKKAILEVATSNLQKWPGFAQSWGPCMPIWHPLTYILCLFTGEKMQWRKTCSFKRPCIVLCIPCFKTNLPQPLLLIFEFFGRNQWTNIIFPLIRIITTNLIKPAILIILCINLMLFLIIPEFKDHKK